MIQLINILINLSLLFQVIYLFTCGQDYMRISIKRARRNYAFEKLAYSIMGILAFIQIFYSDEIPLSSTLLTAIFSLMLYLKIDSIIHFNKRKIT